MNLKIILKKQEDLPNFSYKDHPWYKYNKLYYTNLSVDTIIKFIDGVLSDIEKHKLEVALEITETQLKFKLVMVSFLINSKFFILHKAFDNELLTDCDFSLKKYRRKAKLEQINSDIKFDPKELFEKSWYSELYPTPDAR